MADLPDLTPTDVRNWTEQRFYDRGKTYVRQGRSNYPDAWETYIDQLYDDELHRLRAARDEFEKRDLL